MEVGARVRVNGRNVGTIKFVGTTSFGAGKWLGIQLDDPVGKNNGTVRGTTYFEAPAKTGVFAREANVELIKEDKASGTPTGSKKKKKKKVKAQKIKVSPKKSRGSSSSPKNATKDRNLQRKLATLFKQYDADNSNSIDASELHKLLCDYGRHTSSAEPSIEEAEMIIKSIDKRGNGMLMKKEFVDFVSSSISSDPNFGSFLDEMDSVIVGVRAEKKARVEKNKLTGKQLKRLFKLYDKDGNGTIDADEMRELLCDFGKHTGTSDPTMSEVSTIMSTMAGPDGLVHEAEFCKFVTQSIDGDPSFADFLDEIVIVVDGVKKDNKKRAEDNGMIRERLHILFKNYDGDNDGHINADELYRLLSDFGKHTDTDLPTMDEVNTIVQSVDKNGDGLVQADEFVAFVERTIAKDPTFVDFLSEVTAVINGISSTDGDGLETIEIGADDASKTEEVLRRKLHMLFCEYDVDGNGSIDTDELHKLLSDYGKHTGSAQPSKEDVKSFIKSVDKNGDMRLQESEFVEFVTKATQRDKSFIDFVEKISVVLEGVRKERG